MRYLTAVAMFALLAALAGCGPPEYKPGPAPNYGKPTAEQLKQEAAKFHDKEANRAVSGNQIPLKFVDKDGTAVDLATYRGKNVVLVVVKGMPPSPGGIFCPGCLAQVNALTANYKEFEKRQTEILMVFPGAKDKLPQFLQDGKVDGVGENPKVPFPLLLDTDSKAVNALGIEGQLAKPSTYILDKKGNAVFAFVGESTSDRPSVPSLLTRLDKLNAQQ